MVQINEQGDLLSISFPSKPSQADQAVGECALFMARFTDQDLSDFKLVLGEMLKNAVMHGNSSDPGKSVSCVVNKVENGLFSITVSDQGSGFDHQALRHDSEDPFATGGLSVIRSFSESLEFSEAGSVATAHMRFELKETADDSSSGPWLVVEGDQAEVELPDSLTREVVEDLRQALADAVTRGVTGYVFDLGAVGNMEFSAMNLFQGLARELAANPEASLVMRGARGEVADILSLAGMDEQYAAS